MRLFLRLALVALALGAALAPWPAPAVERFYSRGVYPVVQSGLTALSNRAGFALFDIALAVLLLAAALIVRGAFGRGKKGRVGAVGRAALNLASLAALVYLAFLLLWGFNYRRVRLADALDFDRERVTDASVATLGRTVVARLNALDAAVHGEGWPEWAQTPRLLRPSFERVQRQLGANRAARPGVPKWSVLSLYFERAGVDGMTDPFFLEVLVNRGVLPFERPFVLAHEWAHLAGRADEAEANFLGWLVCLQGPPTAEYSGHLSLLWQVLAAVPPDGRAGLLRELRPQPRRDLQAVSARLARTTPALRRVSWRIYDRYLKANRVEQGVRSYGAALELMLGTRMEEGHVPVLRTQIP